ncbi:CPBP family intramembrane glutamic endopeptidase [Rubrobacter aplysinae]|uniref:CPBP family intramembrane glutamic endopeptidase n=1 Tax=Rubrobacter aplysinae TaxID=909625 RepID=UPI000B22CDA8|nr:type II CAAX endopeptidase family protein [Rubrobacter aplysinae]
MSRQEILTQPFVEELENGRRRPRALWRILAQLVLFLVASAFLTAPLVLVFAAMGAPGGGSPQPSGGGLLLISSVASLLAALLAVWAAGRFLDRRRLRDYGLRLNRGWWLDLGFGLALGAALMTAIFLIELGMGWVSVTGGFATGSPGGAPFWLAILGPVATFVCVGVYEELLTRGYQLKNISEGLGGVIGPRTAILTAWILTSSVFGLLHLPNPNSTLLSTVNIALAGLMLGAGYILGGSLAIPIGLHITWNFFQAGVFGFPVSGLDSGRASFLAVEQGGPEAWTGGPFGPEAGLLTVFATLLGVLLISLWMRLRNGKVGLHLPLAARPGDHASNSGPSAESAEPR